MPLDIFPFAVFLLMVSHLEKQPKKIIEIE